MSPSGDSYGSDAGQYNPYAGGTSGMASPLGAPDLAFNGDRPFPTAVTIIGILFLVFGILGLLAGTMGLIQFAFLQFMPISSSDPMSAGMNKAIRQAAPVHIVNGLLNLGLSTFMIISSVGLLKKQLWGAKLGTTVAISAIIYKLIESVGGWYAQWIMMEQMQNNMFGSSPNVDPTTMRWIILGGMAVGFMIVAVPLMIFYGWVAYYLRRDLTRAHFSSSSTTPGS
jgi:hypothetical protein